MPRLKRYWLPWHLEALSGCLIFLSIIIFIQSVFAVLKIPAQPSVCTIELVILGSKQFEHHCFYLVVICVMENGWWHQVWKLTYHGDGFEFKLFQENWLDHVFVHGSPLPPSRQIFSTFRTYVSCWSCWWYIESFC